MSLDPPFIPEMAEPGFLAPVPDDVAQRVTQNVVAGALAGATWDDKLVDRPVLGEHAAALVPQVRGEGGRARSGRRRR